MVRDAYRRMNSACRVRVAGFATESAARDALGRLGTLERAYEGGQIALRSGQAAFVLGQRPRLPALVVEDDGESVERRACIAGGPARICGVGVGARSVDSQSDQWIQ